MLRLSHVASLVVEMNACMPLMHPRTPVISLCLLLFIVPRFLSLLLFFLYEFPLPLQDQ